MQYVTDFRFPLRSATLVWLGRVVRSLTATTERCEILLGGDVWRLTILVKRWSSIRREKYYWGVVIRERFLLFYLFEECKIDLEFVLGSMGRHIASVWILVFFVQEFRS